MRRGACLGALVALVAGCHALAQVPEQTETLHITSRLVEIAAVVVAKDGVPRAGLTKDDFTLKQDGKDQAIRYFSQGQELPLTIALVVDTSGSQETFLDDESRASDVFFETVLGRPQDRAALVEVNAQIKQLAPLTNAPNRLHLALLGMRPAREDMAQTRLYDAIYSLCSGGLAKERGRKAIIVLSDGGDRGSRVSQGAAIEEAERANIPIYSVSYSAWDGNGAALSMRMSGVSTAAAGGDPGLEILKKLSEGTGGRVFSVSRGTTLKHIFDDIAQELRTQYEIGYTLPADTEPNRFHKLELRAKDKALRVQARSGFFAKE